MKRVLTIFIILLILVMGGFYVKNKYLSDNSEDLSIVNKSKVKNKQEIHYVALGDSLTEGIGDESKQGGFVPVVSQNMKESFSVKKVDVTNAGVAGQRSDQILKRVNNSPDLQSKIKDADVITLTVGGNDLLKVIRANVMKLSVNLFNEALIDYQKNVTSLMDKLRELNSDAPIYVLGIYNPFYLNFSDISEFQTIIDNWNNSTETIISENRKTFFIPINKLLYKGVDPQASVQKDNQQKTNQSESSNSESTKIVENNALSQEDKFHPNSTGYRLIAKAIKEKLMKTKAEWLVKG